MLNRDFREFAESLNAARVDYLVVGGYALAAHGHPRYTGDIDFWVRPTPVVQLGRPPRRIDLLTTLDGMDFDACYARCERIEIDGLAMTFIGLDDFKANKRATGRLKDLADLEALDPPTSE